MKTPGFVSRIQAEATQTSIRITWAPPTCTTYTNESMDVDQYYVTYTSGWYENSRFEQCVKEAAETEFEVACLEPNTYTLFTIAAQYQGRLGPQVSIGISTSNVHILKCKHEMVWFLKY